MKNIFLLFPILFLLSSCECDETNPLASSEDITIPDVFLVNGLEYATFFLDGEPREGIIITFNRAVNPQSVVPGETLVLEGEDVFHDTNFYVDFNQVMIQCGQFYCMPTDGCVPSVRLTNVLDAEDKVLDGDRDGKPGGVFIEDVAVSGCPLPAFQVQSIFPFRDTLTTSQVSNNWFISITFTLPVDVSTARFGENIKLVSQPSGTVVPLSEITWSSFGPYALFFQVNDPLRFCDFDPDCDLELIIEDSLQSQAGTALDGNEDGEEGGDYVKSYLIIG